LILTLQNELLAVHFVFSLPVLSPRQFASNLHVFCLASLLRKIRKRPENLAMTLGCQLVHFQSWWQNQQLLGPCPLWEPMNTWPLKLSREKAMAVQLIGGHLAFSCTSYYMVKLHSKAQETELPCSMWWGSSLDSQIHQRLLMLAKI
jgi:hypothetical protein